MSLIRINNLTFCYDGSSTPVFKDLDINIDTDWKLGLIGRNGRGKTTLLALLDGTLEHGGAITSSVEFYRFPYSVPDKTELCYDILRRICPTAEDWEMIRELSLLQTDASTLYRPFRELSGGEQTKLLLSGLFLNADGFPLIDEPTNHLDDDGRRAVARYLKRKRGFILVSHDRAFLDGCIDHVLSINKSDIEIRGGNFSAWQRDFDARQTAEREQNARLKSEIGKLEESARRTAAWANVTESKKLGVDEKSGLRPDKGYIGHKSAKLMKRAKATEKRIDAAIEQKSALFKNTENTAELAIAPLAHHAVRLASFKDVSIFYGERKVCDVPDFEIMRGDRIAISGKNGCGKSSLLKLLLGADITHSGKIDSAFGLKISYVPQLADGLRGTLTEFAKDSDIDETMFKTILRKMCFDRAEFDADISRYSLGQRKKVLLAKSLCEKCHIYVWDEPLNYLDIYTRIQIEKLILQYAPTMIFVEHDEAFRQAVCTKTVEL